MHFGGFTGALSLALIAFSVVFMVLGALTLLIHAMRVVSTKGNLTPAKKTSFPVPAAPSAPVAAGGCDEELVAVITGALIAELGSDCVITGIRPSISGHLIGTELSGWVAASRVESLQGALCGSWN